MPTVVHAAVDEFETSIHETDWPDLDVLAESQPQLNQIFGLHCLDGRTVWVSSNWTPLYTEGGHSTTAAPGGARQGAGPYSVLVSLVDQVSDKPRRLGRGRIAWTA